MRHKDPAPAVISLKRLLQYVVAQGWNAEALTGRQLEIAINKDTTTTLSMIESTTYKGRCKDCKQCVVFTQTGYPCRHTRPDTNKACKMKKDYQDPDLDYGL